VHAATSHTVKLWILSQPQEQIHVCAFEKQLRPIQTKVVIDSLVEEGRERVCNRVPKEVTVLFDM
jgi:hypothetical protein